MMRSCLLAGAADAWDSAAAASLSAVPLSGGAALPLAAWGSDRAPKRGGGRRGGGRPPGPYRAS